MSLCKDRDAGAASNQVNRQGLTAPVAIRANLVSLYTGTDSRRTAMDPRKTLLLEALKTGAASPDEQRLYRRGKLPGLFEQRTRLAGEIATQAVQDGLLEITRVETVGKT